MYDELTHGSRSWSTRRSAHRGHAAQHLDARRGRRHHQAPGLRLCAAGDATTARSLREYTMTTLEELGLLKMDFLGLRNITVIDDAIRDIRKTEPDFSMARVTDNDPKVMDMLTQGRTAGVFQMESTGMTGVCMGLKPQSIEDLSIIVAAYRPGPMESIPRLIACKQDPSLVKYKHPMLQPILSVTYGCILYQEQVIEIFRKLAGYSLGQADMVRRAMSKKEGQGASKRSAAAFIRGDAALGHCRLPSGRRRARKTVAARSAMTRSCDLSQTTPSTRRMPSATPSYAYPHRVVSSAITRASIWRRCMTTVLDSLGSRSPSIFTGGPRHGHRASCRRTSTSPTTRFNRRPGREHPLRAGRRRGCRARLRSSKSAGRTRAGRRTALFSLVPGFLPPACTGPRTQPAARSKASSRPVRATASGHHYRSTAAADRTSP